MSGERVIHWERAPGIDEMVCVKGRAVDEPGYALELIAIAKMAKVERISATFNGEMRLFEPMK